MINVVASDRGWLFEDIKRHFERVSREGASEVAQMMAARPLGTADDVWRNCSKHTPDLVAFATETAEPTADAWIYIRTAEAAESPDLSRSLIQIHDLFDDYGPGGPRGEAVRRAGSICFSHPLQARQLGDAGVWGDPLRSDICRPIGALEAFKPATEPRPDRPFTVGWCGRPFVKDGRDLKRTKLFFDAVRLLCSKPVVGLAGQGSILSKGDFALRADGYDIVHPEPGPWEETGPSFYHSIDCLVATSESPAVPLPVFEALRSGVPVVSTPRSWPGLVEFNDGESAEELAEAIRFVRDFPDLAKTRARTQQAKLAGYTMDGWIRENLELAACLAKEPT